MTLFASSPARLPYHPPSIILTLIAYYFVAILILGDQRSQLSILLQLLLEVALLFSVSYIFLKYRNRTARLLQTLSALIGINLVISTVSLPFYLTLSDSLKGEEISQLTQVLYLLLLLWNLAVISLIFKRAFEIRTIVAGIITFNYYLLYELLWINLFKESLL